MTKLDPAPSCLNPAPHDLSESSRALRRGQQDSAGHKVSLELAPDLPMLELDARAGSNRCCFNCWTTRLSNAHQIPHIDPGLRDRGLDLALQILDEGNEHCGRRSWKALFDKFYRAQKGASRPPGTGLGSRSRAASSKRAWHDSTGNRADRAGGADDPSFRFPPPRRYAGYRRMNAPQIKVLVIDDEPPIRILLRMGLSTQATTFSRGVQRQDGAGNLGQEPALNHLDSRTARHPGP